MRFPDICSAAYSTVLSQYFYLTPRIQFYWLNHPTIRYKSVCDKIQYVRTLGTKWPASNHLVSKRLIGPLAGVKCYEIKSGRSFEYKLGAKKIQTEVPLVSSILVNDR